ELGCSPRASLALMKASQAHAAIMGRDYVIPEDVKAMAVHVLSHRLILKNDMSIGVDASEKAVQDILSSINTPLEEI
ncbi:AAA family ATPase, partial [Oceanirhabdus seepicola]|nr:magnesium chelatase [Oceanirhabdus seepicola]